MSNNVVTITRKELYDRIWKDSARKVARELGITDVQILLICRQYQIPKPSSAYWAAVARGKPSEKPLLPEVADGIGATVEINRAKKPVSPQASPPSSASSTPEPITRQPTQAAIPDTLRSPLPLIERTNLSLRDGKPGGDGIISLFNKTGCLNVSVSKEQIGRAMRFLDTLFKAAIARGMTIKIADEDRKKVTLLTVKGIDLQFRLHEVCRQREKKLSAAEKARYQTFSKESARYYLFEKYACGDLSLFIEGSFGNSKNWIESAGKRIELYFEKILSKAEELAESVRLDQIKSDDQQRRWDEEKRIREEREAIERKQQLLRSQLREQVERWQRAESIRRFVAAARAKAVKLDEGSDLAKWLTWAEGVASKLDPLRDPIEDLPKRRRKDYMPFSYPKEPDWSP
jgi:hypothetical protein